MNGKTTLIKTLANSELYQDYERAFTEATGLPIALRPIESWQLPLHGKRKENPFCALIASRSRACAACLQMQEKLAQSAREKTGSMTCSYGLSETAVPVRVGQETIGYLQTGQIMQQKPTNAQCSHVAKLLAEQGLDFDPQSVKKAYFKTPVVSEKKMRATAHLLSVFADHLRTKGNQIALQASNSEPPVIAKAKQYIEAHYTEELSLGQVAAAVHMSLFYFCKVFKKATGINFTEFVSRTRTEKAKNLLLNPNLRVSEIAYEVGFQSLTHFNRIFKKVVGQSPTEYREQLPAT